MSIAPISTALPPKPSFNFLLVAPRIAEVAPRSHPPEGPRERPVMMEDSGTRVAALLLLAKALACMAASLLLHALAGPPAASLPLALLCCYADKNRAALPREVTAATFGSLLFSSARYPLPELWQWIACLLWAALGAAAGAMGLASSIANMLVFPLGIAMLCRGDISYPILAVRAVAYAALNTMMAPDHKPPHRLVRCGAVLLSSDALMLLVACSFAAPAYAAAFPPLRVLLARNAAAKNDMEDDDERL